MLFAAKTSKIPWIIPKRNLFTNPKVRTTGAYCSTLFLQWANETTTTLETCSDCALGVQQIELGSPFGYQTDIASDFAFTTSSCQISNYGYTSPTSALTASTTTATTQPSSCTVTYALQDDDTCTSISLAQNISTFSLLTENGLEAYCNNFPTTPGTLLCLPSQCNIYTIETDDTCSSIIASAPRNITLYDLIAWNPNINNPCSNLHQLVYLRR